MDTSMTYNEETKRWQYSSDDHVFINRMKKLAKEHPDEVVVLGEPETNDGCMYITFPRDWLKIAPKRKVDLTDEKRAELAERLARLREKARGEKKMTGLECLKEELIEKGYTRAQVDSKVVLGVLEVLANSDAYLDENRLLNEIEFLKSARAENEKQQQIAKEQLQACKTELEAIIDDLNKKAEAAYGKQKSYIDSFFKALQECETPEGRDTLRTAQMFVNSITIETDYDRYAYITGLASILSKGKTASMGELRKVNDEIPKLEFDTRTGRYAGKYERPKRVRPL